MAQETRKSTNRLGYEREADKSGSRNQVRERWKNKNSEEMERDLLEMERDLLGRNRKLGRKHD